MYVTHLHTSQPGLAPPHVHVCSKLHGLLRSLSTPGPRSRRRRGRRLLLTLYTAHRRRDVGAAMGRTRRRRSTVPTHHSRRHPRERRLSQCKIRQDAGRQGRKNKLQRQGHQPFSRPTRTRQKSVASWGEAFCMSACSTLTSGVAVWPQIDFGLDNTGKKILTLTNPEETILCVSKGRHQQVFLVQQISSIPRAHKTQGFR
jgi:hypothetical protein